MQSYCIWSLFLYVTTALAISITNVPRYPLSPTKELKCEKNFFYFLEELLTITSKQFWSENQSWFLVRNIFIFIEFWLHNGQTKFSNACPLKSSVTSFLIWIYIQQTLNYIFVAPLCIKQHYSDKRAIGKLNVKRR